MKVGGDYFDFFKLNDHHLGVVVADVSGHGLSASQVMAMAKMSFYHHFNFNDKLSDIVFKINKDLTDNIKTGHYLTACVCIIDTKKKSLRYSRVSHPYPILINKNKPKLTELDSKGMILGKFENGRFEEKTISLNTPCRLFLYTDGLFEIYFERKSILGRGLIKDFLLKNINIPNENIIGKLMEFRKNHVEKYIKDYVDEDDIVAVCIDIE